MGRVKLEIRKIENPTNRQVTYSKRRNGLIKKAYELSVLCEIDIALLMFSPSGRLNHFSGKKRIEDVIARFASLSDHERTKSQCLKWCDSQTGANAPRKIENPDLLIKAARKLKQESYITVGSQFPSSRSTSLEAVQYEIQRTQVQLQEMESRLRIYEADVKGVNSIQQLENLEQHLRNALETLRMHKHAMENNNTTHAVNAFIISSPGPNRSSTSTAAACAQMAQLYGMMPLQLHQHQAGASTSVQLQQQQQQQNLTTTPPPPAASHVHSGSVLLHHWLQSTSTTTENHAAAAGNHHGGTPNAVDHTAATILSLRESPGECSSAGSSLYTRAQHQQQQQQLCHHVNNNNNNNNSNSELQQQQHHVVDGEQNPAGAAEDNEMMMMEANHHHEQMGLDLACRKLYRNHHHDCSDSSPCDDDSAGIYHIHGEDNNNGGGGGGVYREEEDYPHINNNNNNIDMNHRYVHHPHSSCNNVDDVPPPASASLHPSAVAFSAAHSADHLHHHQWLLPSSVAAATMLSPLQSLAQAQAVMGMMLQASRRPTDQIQQQQDHSRSSVDTDNSNVMMSVPTSFIDIINHDGGSNQLINMPPDVGETHETCASTVSNNNNHEMEMSDHHPGRYNQQHLAHVEAQADHHSSKSLP